MNDKPVSPRRQRMIEDMTVRHFKEKVQKDYIRHVTNFKDFLGRSPDTATSEDKTSPPMTPINPSRASSRVLAHLALGEWLAEKKARK